MRRRSMVRSVTVTVFLTLSWCAMWGQVSAANLLSGLLVSVVVGRAGVSVTEGTTVRLRPLAGLVALVFADLVVSSLAVARHILGRRGASEAVIAVTLPAEARRHLLLLVVAVTVTPGTAVVDTDPDSGTLYLHLLNSAEREATELHVRRIADLACRALPTRANREVAT